MAHRGASRDAPENTLASFTLAWEQQADAIEGDFYLTRDRRIVCIHDATTERVSSVNLPVAQCTLDDLRQLDVGSWKAAGFAGAKIPTLPEVLDCVPKSKQVFIEIKCGPEIIPTLQTDLQASSLQPDQTAIISFNAEVIEAAKRAMPERPAYWLVKFDKDESTGRWLPTCDKVIHTASRIGADGVDLAGDVEAVDQAFVSRCGQAGLSVHVWTIDDVRRAEQFQRLGVDSITTNRPRELRKALSKPSPLPAPVPTLHPVAQPTNSSGATPR
ncbi:MAG: glycerophosphodiester phosphodiesterase [Planctomycetales bacterium]|nr:glycerophosphodiester phosphodiesterase [Planctomycetales bacterium]